MGRTRGRACGDAALVAGAVHRRALAPAALIRLGLAFGVVTAVGTPSLTLRLNDGTAAKLTPGTYAAIRRKWSAGDLVELDLPM